MRGIRRKLIASFLIVALIPLLLLVFINKQTTEKALTDNARQALAAAADETANRIDTFIDENLNAVRVEAILPGVVSYLSLTPKRRRDSPEKQLVTKTLIRLSRKDMLNILSYALLDLKGRNILDTQISNIGKDESEQDYFKKTVETGLPFVSSMKISPKTPELITLFFSSPVRNSRGDILGVLRVSYNATVIEQLVTRETERAGSKSFAILLDENYIFLAHSSFAKLLFKSILPLPSHLETELQKERRLLNYSQEELEPNQLELKQALHNKKPYLIASLKARDNQVNLITIARLKYKPWSVLFAQPIAVALAPVKKQICDALFLFAVIGGLVTVIALTISQLLTQPIIHLTNIVFQFTTGHLDIRAKISSKDEIGQLAKSFNDMAFQLQTAFETLEQRVQERTAQLVIAKQKAEDANQKLEQLVNLDGLTQVANRRCFNGRLQAEWERLAREKQPLSLILFDVDQFKSYNDYYGHLEGDDCLIRTQAVQQTVCCAADLVARYGGEEFSVLLSSTDLAGAIKVAQNIQQAIHDLVIPHAKSDVKDIVTVSMGITSRIPTLDIKPDILITLADKALYDAKQKGRDRYCYHV